MNINVRGFDAAFEFFKFRKLTIHQSRAHQSNIFIFYISEINITAGTAVEMKLSISTVY